MKNSNRTVSAAVVEAMQARLAFRVAGRLSEGADALEADLSERLRFAREKALERARLARAAAPAAAPALVSSGSSAALLGGGGWWVKLASVLPLAVLAAGLLLIEHLHTQSQIATAADIDAELLIDDLPPAAYTDPGFAEFLKTPSE
ncbi:MULTISPECIES: DUF3619 family protein [Piscinibacter]|uniref:DUF3619 family protein n=1 Tax=Piscinibacter TaxID=1114981 RepID=UPI001F0C0933|nr:MULTISPECIES: DUF3619 family protein [Piscinibacter]